MLFCVDSQRTDSVAGPGDVTRGRPAGCDVAADVPAARAPSAQGVHHVSGKHCHAEEGGG